MLIFMPSHSFIYQGILKRIRHLQNAMNFFFGGGGGNKITINYANITIVRAHNENIANCIAALAGWCRMGDDMPTIGRPQKLYKIYSK